MSKFRIVNIIILSIIFASCTSISSFNSDELEQININISDSEGFISASYIIKSDSASVIKIDNSHIVSTTDVKICDGSFYFVSPIENTIDIFSSNGAYLRSIGKWGQGPGEYTAISDFYPTSNYIYILDFYIKKIFVYDYNNTCVREIKLDKIIGNKLFVIGDAIYLINEFSDTPMGKYHLFRISPDNEIEAFIPFKNVPGLAAEEPYSSNGEVIYYISRADNIIYCISEDDVRPVYKLNFGEYTLPDKYYKLDARELMVNGIDNKYCSGIDRILASEKYLFLFFWIGESRYIALYDITKNKLSHVCKGFDARQMLFAKGISHFTINDGCLYDIYSADFLKFQMEIWKPFPNIDKAYVKEMENLKNSISDEDNPVIFKFYLKNEQKQ